MSVKYKSIERGNPGDPTKPKKHYAQAVSDGEIGSLYISNKSEGSETADKVTASNIKSAKVDFRPGTGFKMLVKVLEWVKVK